MSLIALHHERHGTHIAYSEAEAIECEKVGWIRDAELSAILSGKSAQATQEDAEESAAETVDSAAELSIQDRYERKFGHPPHHRMKEDTIRRSLEE